VSSEPGQVHPFFSGLVEKQHCHRGCCWSSAAVVCDATVETLACAREEAAAPGAPLLESARKVRLPEYACELTAEAVMA
jgi:hypothetical protein